MDDPDPYSWLLLTTVVVVSLLLSAFFSGMEIAFISANRLRIEMEKKQGHYSARLLSRFTRQPSRFIATMLLGNNVALVVYSTFMTDLLSPHLSKGISSGPLLLLTITVISTIIVLFIAEFLPKAAFRSSPNFFLTIFAVPLTLVWVVFYLPMLFTVGLSNLFLKIFKVDVEDEAATFGRVDLEHYVEEVTQSAEIHDESLEHEFEIFQNALEFSKVKARECMVPRTEIVAMEMTGDIKELRQSFIDTGLSKILIYRDSIDNIIGYVHSAELFKQPEKIKSVLLPVSIVPESMAANKVLEGLIKQNRSIAVVVDEFGGTAGIITTEDIVEEIFGEIEDEHDTETATDEALGENAWRFAGRFELDQVNDKYKLDLPESEEYDTIAGLVLHQHESIPDSGSVIRIGDFLITVEEVSDNRIDMLKVERVEDR